MAGSIDDICVIRSMQADVPNHEPSLLLMNCGDARQIRPSLGSWLVLRPGKPKIKTCPAFVAMCPDGYPIQESQNWQAGFLPGVYEGMYIDTQHTDDRETHRAHSQRSHFAARPARAAGSAGTPERAASRRHGRTMRRSSPAFGRSSLAFRMQTEAAEAFDVRREPQHIRDMYGPGVQARQLLIARRLIERGVRFVQLWHGAGQPWDSHDDLK